jgi:hypothetical protein
VLDADLVEAGAQSLDVAIGEIIEDVHDLAVSARSEIAAYSLRAAALRQAGADIAALAEAMQVLVRRGGYAARGGGAAE